MRRKFTQLNPIKSMGFKENLVSPGFKSHCTWEEILQSLWDISNINP